MKWLLISLLLQNPMVYPTQERCEFAVKAIAKMDPDAICIPDD